MNLEVLKQTLTSLDINPDEIEDERYAKAFRILFAIIEIQNEKIETLKKDNQKLQDEIKLLKGEQTKPKIRGSKKMMTSLPKTTDALRPVEQAKIDCGREHFKAMNSDVAFSVANNYEAFTDKLSERGNSRH